jgi:hypothetical protein
VRAGSRPRSHYARRRIYRPDPRDTAHVWGHDVVFRHARGVDRAGVSERARLEGIGVVLSRR